ncbi:MAG: hypothetical protein WC611_09995, partial [Candidatus Neomarinimicrobiota bacterium]
MRRFINNWLRGMLVVCIISSLSFAYTTISTSPVSGTLTVGTYYVQESIWVNSGTTLTLEAGVILKFAEGKQLNIQGTLDVNGSSGSKVYFTSMNDNSIGETISGSTGNPQ